eukprot:gene58034-77440_t
MTRDKPSLFFPRRTFCAAALLAAAACATAQTAYPNKPVRVVVAFTAG